MTEPSSPSPSQDPSAASAPEAKKKGISPLMWVLIILGSIFAVLGALFILSPVGFPWYFVWCVPLLPFARRKSWYLLTGLLFVYYLRFWFAYGTAEEPRAFFGYPPESAEFFFHHWVVSVEFGIFFLAWIVESVIVARRG